jgi:hypothetical protein
MNKIILLLMCLLCLTGCADTVTFTEAMFRSPVGFWYGLWHGVTFGFSFIGSLFMDDIAIYAIYNNGGWYDFGYWLGVTAFVGGAVRSS